MALPKRSKKQHRPDGLTNYDLITRMEYDHANRLIEVHHKIGNEETQIANLNYNERGEMIEKNLGDNDQSVDYQYNIRGWLTHINDGINYDDPEDLFGMELLYDAAGQYNGNIGAMKWKTFGGNENNAQTYDFSYDPLNRLTAAQYNNGISGDGKFDVSGISYDKNGNILSLNRKLDGTNADALTYAYEGNRLTAVGDTRGNSLFDESGSEGLQADEYRYDYNGNMIADDNKAISAITYNELNLPLVVTMANGDYITYVYNAAGNKLRKKSYEGSTLIETTDYIGEMIYKKAASETNEKLQFLQHQEGRVVPRYLAGQSGTITAWDYQYHLKDHLGNVRLTFGTTPENYTMTETFESGETNGWQDLHRHTNSNANTTPGGNEVELLTSGQTGAMLLLQVSQHDTLHLSVNANYETAPSSNGFTGTVYSALFSAYNSSIANGEASSALENEFSEALSGANMAGKDDASSAPRAFLNYIFFDRDMNYISAGFKQISTAALGVGVHENIAINDIIPDRAGYLLTYLSNENAAPVNIHFDDFTVYQGKSRIKQVDDYYPFGGTFNSYTSGTENLYKYNGKEEQKETQWYDYGARMYDPMLGRFFTQDRFAEKYYDFSPYQYAANNPIRYIDVNGDSIWVNYGADQRVLYNDGAFYNEDGSAYEGDNEFIAAVGTTLSEMNGTENGQTVLAALSGSENSFTFSNTASSGGDRSLSFSPGKDGGGTINAAALLNTDIQSGQKLESTAHELFHGYQYENGQGGASVNGINNEVGAYLFGKKYCYFCGIPYLWVWHEYSSRAGL